MNVLSLFDGMSCGQLALQRAGIKYDKYFASEIDKYAISVTQHNFPNTIHLGDVTKVRGEDLPKIDLLIGGSPCQGFSIAGKHLNFADPRSKLFFEFVRLKNELTPKYFLLENVKMKKEWQDIISKYLGCPPVFINSSEFSPQNRQRLYWTNIPFVLNHKKNTQILNDILEENVDEKYYSKKYTVNDIKFCERLTRNNLTLGYVGLDRKRKSQDNVIFNQAKKSLCLRIKCDGYLCNIKQVGYISNKNSQGNRVYNTENKSISLTALGGGSGAKTGLYIEDNRIRKLTPIECERLQTVPDNYSAICSDTQRYKMLGNGWTVNVIAHIFKNLK